MTVRSHLRHYSPEFNHPFPRELVVGHDNDRDAVPLTKSDFTTQESRRIALPLFVHHPKQMVLGHSASSVVCRSRTCCEKTQCKSLILLSAPSKALASSFSPACPAPRRGVCRTVAAARTLEVVGQPPRSTVLVPARRILPRNPPLRSSRDKSTTAIDFTQSSSTRPPPKPSSPLHQASDSAQPAGSILLSPPAPSAQALRSLFVASAIPMVGFGFMVRWPFSLTCFSFTRR